MSFLDYILCMNVYMCLYNRDVAHTNFARRTVVFRLPPVLSTCELFLLTAWCQLVVLEAHEMQSGDLVSNASPLAVLKLQKMSYLTLLFMTWNILTVNVIFRV